MTSVFHLYFIKHVILLESACLSADYVPNILLRTFMSGSPFAFTILLLMGSACVYETFYLMLFTMGCLCGMMCDKS